MNASQVPTSNWWSKLKLSAQSFLGLTSQFQTTASPALQCSPSALSPFLPSHATIISAVSIAANGTWTQPSPPFPKAATGLPALCAVTVNVISSPTSSFNFGLFLPDEWNLRFMGSGNGGFGGGINWNDMETHALSGFASMSTDTGHVSAVPDASWALNNPETQIDWGHRAMHNSVKLSKLITQKYYSAKIKYSYFSACSTGGRQGFKSIQKYPSDFDGIVSAAPAWWTSHLQPWHLAVSLWNLPLDSPHHIPGSLFKVIAEEAIRQCDPQDGVLDGIISNPRACIFRPETLLCTPTSKPGTCLTLPQLKTLDKIQSPWIDTNATFLFPSLSLGSETEFGRAMNLDSGHPSPMGTVWLSNFLLNHSSSTASSYNWAENFDLATVQLGDELNPGEANADDFDITPLADRGGKVIHYHGYSDGLIPAEASIYLHNQILRTLIPKGLSRPISSFYKLYMIPGLQHCRGSTGDAPWYIAGGGQPASLGATVKSVPGYEDARHDVVLALMRWVEEGIEPEEIVATKFVDDDVEKGVRRQRPVCVYPKHAKWDGVGDQDLEGSWACVDLY
ncbi:tannase and feruloyl esterase [Mollisia scopiformis]|uniref:Carboxylic ester hydrolase n=1 Tax=Mollisia scopiformis TaxID=149040 RepID=A0A194WW53_MOLSC|nr:tannase and feruloyl esterase [Mollisia scopiformis]KUJ12196.1 tannase and feruloyl esterase [Mollisia scopiformis]